MATAHAATSRNGARSASKAKRDRLEVRIDHEQKELVMRAAALQGRTVSDFVASSVRAAAEQAVREHSVITLSVQDSQAFLEALARPASPSARLQAAAERYRAVMGDQ